MTSSSSSAVVNRPGFLPALRVSAASRSQAGLWSAMKRSMFTTRQDRDAQTGRHATRGSTVSRRWDDAGGIVTPEAVPLQMSEANVGSRTIAWFIDAIALGTATVLLNLLIVMLGSDAPIPEWVGITVLVVLNFLLFFGYPIAFETLMGGRTPGKAALGLRVVTAEGAPVRFRHAAIRAALGLVDFWLTSGVAAVLSTLLTKRHQRLGDLVAGTLVLRERTAAAAPTVARFRVPTGAEDYAATIDPTGLSPGDYETVREFLLRAATLRSQARADIGRQL